MSSANVLQALQVLNTFLGLARDLNINFAPLSARLRDGTDLTAAELNSYLAETRAELDDLKVKIDQMPLL